MSWTTVRCWLSVLVGGAACMAVDWAYAGERPAPQLQATFYVATDGNDSWSGTLATPKTDRSDGPLLPHSAKRGTPSDAWSERGGRRRWW